jgi:hypothetical protein
MQDFSPILDNIAPAINFDEQEKALFMSVLKIRKLKLKRNIEQPGFVSKYRTFISTGALRRDRI